MKMDKEHFRKFMIKEEDLVCKIGDVLKLMRDVDIVDDGENDMADDAPFTHYVASGQLYKAADRKGAGWDLVRIDGDGPPNIRVLNGSILHYFEVVK